VLRQQILQLGDALVDPVAPFLFDQPVGQLVSLLERKEEEEGGYEDIYMNVCVSPGDSVETDGWRGIFFAFFRLFKYIF